MAYSPLLLWLLALSDLVLGLPYGGWGPKDGFGHTGNSFPARNPNAIYGYDFHGLFDSWTTYGSVYNPHRKNGT